VFVKLKPKLKQKFNFNNTKGSSFYSLWANQYFGQSVKNLLIIWPKSFDLAKVYITTGIDGLLIIKQ
jgi:hypothetical protein